MPTNMAVWLPAKGATLAIKEAPFPKADAKQIVVRGAAVSINPIDWILPSVGGLIFPWLRYPLVPGWDVAGEVVAIGGDVTRFKIGDRVLGLAVGQDKSVNDPAEGAFQTYTLLREHMTAPLADDLSYEQAAVLPLALSTAACGLFQADKLALATPMAAAPPTNVALLIWGGATSVGSNAIQLAVAAGYQVFTTASPRNHDYVRSLGASHVFDRSGSAVVRDIVRALKGRTLGGAMAIGTGSAKPCIDIVGACEGKKFVALASPPVSFDDAPMRGGKRLWLGKKLMGLLGGNIGLVLRARRRGVRFTFVNGSSILDDGIGRMIYVDFLPQALASGRFRAAPEPIVVGKGLSAIPDALEVHKQGVSARKIVVAL